MGWEPPSEEEFNNDWMTVREARKFAQQVARPYAERWLLDQLKEGLIAAVARSGPLEANGPMKPMVPVMPGQWSRWDDEGPEYFWTSGVAVFEKSDSTGYGSVITDRFFDVRFNPRTFNGKINVAPEPEAPAIPRTAGEPEEVAPAGNRKPMPDALLQKWAELFRQAYPDGNQTLARRSIDGMFPDKKATRAQLRRVIPAAPIGKPKENKG